MISEDKLVPGARVEWESQAGGFTTKKHGTIVAFVPKRQKIETQTLELLFRLHGVACSHIDRYLIRLDPKARAKVTHYYVPVASVVRKGKLIAVEGEPVLQAAPVEGASP